MISLSLEHSDPHSDPLDLIWGRSDLAEAIELEAGAVLFCEGAEVDALYRVESGRVRVELEQGEIDSDAVLDFARAGEIIGELGILDGGTRSASAVADEATRLLKVTTARLSQLEASDPRLAARIFRALGAEATAKLRKTNKRLAAAIFESRDAEVNQRVQRAQRIRKSLIDAEESAIEALLDTLTLRFEAEAERLAALTVEITSMGEVASKVEKNHFACRGVRESLRGQPGVGIALPGSCGVSEIRSPAGVIFGLIPVTNPVATAFFKSLICLKSRNALILSFPRKAAKLGAEVDQLIRTSLKAAGWSEDLIQIIYENNSRKRTDAFFHHPDVDLILATGGPSMVRAAYSSGKPALGVGAGNAPVLICEDARLDQAAERITLSKSFDHGLICGSEHNLVVVESVRTAFVSALEKAGAAVLTEAETTRFQANVLDSELRALRRRLVGCSAEHIAALAEVERPYRIRLIVVPAGADAIEARGFYTREKMAPVLSLFPVPDAEAGIELSQYLLECDGRGHTAVIHTESNTLAEDFGRRIPASRILVNSPATQGVIGLTTGLAPSLTLGCGFYGGNSTTDNVGYTNLCNLKRLALFRQPSE